MIRDIEFTLVCDRCGHAQHFTEANARCFKCGSVGDRMVMRKVSNKAKELEGQIRKALYHEPYTEDGCKRLVKDFRKLIGKSIDYNMCITYLNELARHYSRWTDIEEQFVDEDEEGNPTINIGNARVVFK